MILFLLSYLAGVLTIVSPCILPVLPFVFARSDRPFVRSGLPLLAGMAATFAGVASLAAVGGGCAVQANEAGRVAALALLGLFGIALLFPALSDRLTRPLVALGSRLSQSADRAAARGGAGVGPSLLLGVAIGLLWAPCAGPVLGLILTGAALHGASVQTSLLLAAYALGAATSLALALLVGGRVFKAMKRSLGVGQWIRRGLGAAMLAAVAVIAFGLDTSALTRISAAGTTTLEQGLLAWFRPSVDPPATSVVMQGGGGAMMTAANASMMGQGAAPAGPAKGDALPIEGNLPDLAGAVAWLNSPKLTTAELKGKVVLVDFWTYSCINCLREIPYVRAWAEKYRDQGLVVIGVHAPEFAFERNIDNVKKAVADLKVDFPVAIDNNFSIWRGFNNQYWPAEYFVDAQGRIRHHAFGEGEYARSEQVIQTLLAETGTPAVGTGLVAVQAAGAEAAADTQEVLSPETYIGAARAENFVSPGGAVQGEAHAYVAGALRLNEWGLSGNWTIAAEHASLNEKDGGITYRFHARDLHLVLGPGAEAGPIRFRVTIDGAPPGEDHGADIDAAGNGIATGQRLYQLIRQMHPVGDRTFVIQFLDPGVQAYAFTFG